MVHVYKIRNSCALLFAVSSTISIAHLQHVRTEGHTFTYVLSARGRCHQMLSHSLAESETGEWNLVSTRGLPLFVIEISGLLWNYHYIILAFKYNSFPFIDKILSVTLDIPIRLFCNGNYLWFFCVAKIDVFLSSNLIVDCSWLNFMHVVIFGLFSFVFVRGNL